MTTQKYSILDAQDLLNNLKNTFLFINSGVPEHHLDESVMSSLLDYSERTVLEIIEIVNNLK